MKRKLMSFCAAVVVVASVSITLLSSNAVKNKGEDNVSYAQRPQHYNEAADMNTTRNEAADMNSTTLNNPVNDYLDNKTDGLSNSASIIGGLLGGLGGDSEGSSEDVSGSDSGLGLDFGSGGGLGDAIGGIGDIFSGILGGETSEETPSTTEQVVVTYPLTSNVEGYIDPVPAVTYIENQTTVNTSVATEPATAAPSVVVSQSETVNFNSTTNPYKKPAGEINPGDSGEGVKWMQWIFIYTNYGLKGRTVTGVYDEETEALVRKLQEEKGLTVDGIVNDAVVDKIELLYYEYSITATTSSAVTLIAASDTMGANTTGTDNSENSDSLGLVVVILAAIWCVAIIGIMIIFILKKKKKKQAKENSTDITESSSETETSETPTKTNDMSLSDLFEEANK